MYPAGMAGSLAKDWIDDLKKKNNKYLQEFKIAIKMRKKYEYGIAVLLMK